MSEFQNLLQEEYFKRNEQLPLEKKIFSMRILSKIIYCIYL